MWCNRIIIMCLLNTVLGLDMNALDFSIDYLKYRKVKFVCLLTCDKNSLWDIKFTKMASNQSMIVSKLMMDDHSLLRYDRVLGTCLHQKCISVGVVVDRDCKHFEELIYSASQHKYLDAMHKWMIMANENCMNGEQTRAEIFSQMNISVDVDIVMALKNDNSTYVLYDVFNFGKIQGGGLIIKEVGSWDSEMGLNLLEDLSRYKYYRRWNFQDWSMRMVLVATTATNNVDLKVLAELKPIPGVAMLTQASAASLSVVAEIHNFKYTLTITDRWISTFDRNGTKTASNMVYFEEQDISPVIRFLNIINEKIDLLILPLSSIETKYYYRIPTFGPGKFENQFLRPLSSGAWWCVIAVLVLCAILLLIAARFEDRPSTAQYAVFSVVASICQQFFQDIDDSGIRRESTARKLTMLVTGLSCVLVYNYYTSSVVSWLLNGPPPSINSLQELLESPLELIYEDIGYTRSWLQTPTYYYNKANTKIEDEIRKKKVFNKKEDAPLLVPLEKGIKMVKDGGYAYHTEKNMANELISKTFTQPELCELGSLQSMAKADLYPCVQKNSPYKEFMSWSLLQLSERGIVSRIQRRTKSPEVSCEGSSPRALALGGAAPAFILLAVGYILATIFMIVERIIYKWRHPK